ncbi:InlB B-repeat-containing protein, partial [Clostridium beijerinckii]|uniref:InlB B-repeat-containing protein n=1 Tax=Clostridium beijerinckii TaxID=1520 RepID=UPI0022E7FE3C
VLGNTDLAKPGYTFAGWNTAADGNGTDYAAGSSLTVGSGNVTLYAKWTRNQTYAVTYAGNGNTEGTAPTDLENYEGNDIVTVLGNTDLVKPGYTFVGWNTEADGSGIDYAAGSSLTIGSENVTLYAKWTRNQTYTVTYAGNGNTEGTVPTDSGNYEANTEAIVLGNADLVKPGYTFAGWNTAEDGSGIDYAAGSSLTVGSGNVTLYAKWTRNQTYTVTYNGNGNTEGAAPTDL